MSYTLEELQKMGAKPIESSEPKKKYTLEELQGLGAKPVDSGVGQEKKSMFTGGMGIGVGPGVAPMDFSKQISDIGSRIGESVTSLPLRLKEDVVAGAEDMQKGNVLKGILKSGLRTAGDVAGTLFSPITATMGVATEEAGKALPGVANFISGGINKVADVISNIPEVQQFAMKHPEAEKDFERVLNLVMAKGVKGDIAKIPEIVKTGVESGIESAKTGIKTGMQDVYSNLKTGGNEALNTLSNNLNETFKKGTIGVKNIADYANERGIDLGKEIVGRRIKPIVENDRLKFGTEPFKQLDTEISGNSAVIDELIKQYPNTKISANDLKIDISKQIANDPIMKRQGAVPDVTKKAVEKIDDFITQNNGRTDFSLGDIQEYKKGMWEASKKFKMTETGKSDAFSELGKLFMKIVENEVPDARIKGINEKIGRAKEVYKMLDKINSLQDGGIVLKGGKLGKYFTDVIGTGVGGIVGSGVGGPVGAGIGAGIGYNISSLLRSLTQKSSILGPVDRVLIKFAEKMPENTAIRDAKIFIEDVKAGKQPTITPSVQKTIEEAWAKKEAVLPPDQVYEMEMGVYKLGKTPITGIVEPTGQYRDPSKGVNFFPRLKKGESAISKTTENLIQESKKYKTAEKFVKAQGTQVLHGTGTKFETFDDSMRGTLTGAKSAKGAIWFTDDPATAKAYSAYSADEGVVKKAMAEADVLEKIAQRSGKQSDWAKHDAKVVEMEELASYDNSFERRKQANVKDVVINGDLYEVDAKGKTPMELSKEGDIDSWLNDQLEKAKKLGKDGVKITNLDDAVGLYNRPATHYAIFDSKNIKTKSQLTDIWNKANKKSLPLSPKKK